MKHNIIDHQKTQIMKNALMVLVFAASIAACNNSPKTGTETTKDVVTLDTTGLYNDQGKVLDINGANDTVITTVTTTTITKGGTGEALVANEKPAVAPRKTPAKRRTAARSTSSGTRNSGTVASGSGTTQPVAQKKGWSKAAKGTAIGAGSGAVVGAIISKKKGKGAIIGGVVGAGVGYGIGRSKDKKDGRY